MTPTFRRRRSQPDGQWPPTARCISLTTFRRTGDAVSTPVWFVSRGSELWVWTDERSGKVARLRLDPTCRVAPCTMSGTVTGPTTDTRARFLHADEAQLMPVLLRRRYPILKRCLDLSVRLRRRTGAGRSVCIALSPAPSGIHPGGTHVDG